VQGVLDVVGAGDESVCRSTVVTGEWGYKSLAVMGRGKPGDTSIGRHQDHACIPVLILYTEMARRGMGWD